MQNAPSLTLDTYPSRILESILATLLHYKIEKMIGQYAR